MSHNQQVSKILPTSRTIDIYSIAMARKIVEFAIFAVTQRVQTDFACSEKRRE